MLEFYMRHIAQGLHRALLLATLGGPRANTSWMGHKLGATTENGLFDVMREIRVRKSCLVCEFGRLLEIFPIN